MDNNNESAISVGTREELLSRLYALRAGLSVVAQEKEAADGIMARAVKARDKAKKEAEEQCKERGKDLDKAKKKLADLEEKKYILIDAANSPGLAKRVILRILISLVYGIVCLPALAGLSYAVSIICCMFGAFGPESVWTQNPILNGMFTWAMYLDIWACLLVGAASVGLGLGAAKIIYNIHESVSCKAQGMFDFTYKEKKDAIIKLETFDSKLRAKEAAILRAEKNVDTQYKTRDESISAADVLYEKAKDKATEHAVAGLAVMSGLEETFSDMIDARDWENTDLLIYSLETRRAENMKEALQVVDHERRAERIVSAISDAGREICNSINTGLKRLQNGMTRCFGVLNKKIDDQSRIMSGLSGQISSMNSRLADNNKYLAHITSQQNMSNALLAKANANSSELTGEIARLRTAAEYSVARSVYHGY